jgi:hypothetical protein
MVRLLTALAMKATKLAHAEFVEACGVTALCIITDSSPQ